MLRLYIEAMDQTNVLFIIAEPKGEASNCDVLSSPICIYVGCAHLEKVGLVTIEHSARPCDVLVWNPVQAIAA